jgi:hypothetical protein
MVFLGQFRLEYKQTLNLLDATNVKLTFKLLIKILKTPQLLSYIYLIYFVVVSYSGHHVTTAERWAIYYVGINIAAIW